MWAWGLQWTQRVSWSGNWARASCTAPLGAQSRDRNLLLCPNIRLSCGFSCVSFKIHSFGGYHVQLQMSPNPTELIQTHQLLDGYNPCLTNSEHARGLGRDTGAGAPGRDRYKRGTGPHLQRASLDSTSSLGVTSRPASGSGTGHASPKTISCTNPELRASGPGAHLGSLYPLGGWLLGPGHSWSRGGRSGGWGGCPAPGKCTPGPGRGGN